MDVLNLSACQFTLYWENIAGFCNDEGLQSVVFVCCAFCTSLGVRVHVVSYCGQFFSSKLFH